MAVAPQRTDRMKSEMAAIVMALGIYINNVDKPPLRNYRLTETRERRLRARGREASWSCKYDEKSRELGDWLSHFGWEMLKKPSPRKEICTIIWFML